MASRLPPSSQSGMRPACVPGNPRRVHSMIARRRNAAIAPPWQRRCACCQRRHVGQVGARFVSSARQQHAFAATCGIDAERYAPFSRPSHSETCSKVLLGHYRQWRARGADGRRASAPLAQLLLARRALASPAARPIASLRQDSRSVSILDHSCRAAQAFEHNPLHLRRAPPWRPAQRPRAWGDFAHIRLLPAVTRARCAAHCIPGNVAEHSCGDDVATPKAAQRHLARLLAVVCAWPPQRRRVRSAAGDWSSRESKPPVALAPRPSLAGP